MKIGILTFHSQLNYGGVLQCWALLQTLKGMGHDVQVIDRWLVDGDRRFECVFKGYGIKRWLRFAIRTLTGGGDFTHCMRQILRQRRTKQFIERRLNLTPYHIYNWSELTTSDFDFDLIVVGSDQVWHGGVGAWAYPTPEPYLLKDAPNVPAIAYAASFGLKRLPPEIDWVRGFGRFYAISVREAEGVALVENAGANATHVVDPTLLLPREKWNEMGVFRKHSKNVVCYCLIENVEDKINELENWARKTGRHVTIISDKGKLRPCPKTIKSLVGRPLEAIRDALCSPCVCIADDYGPYEFYRAFAEADECITNSFHAVMFSYICNCNVRFLRPVSEERMSMFARIEEFATALVRGRFIVDNLSDALQSFDNDSRVTFDESSINSHRMFSKKWLENAISLKPCRI